MATLQRNLSLWLAAFLLLSWTTSGTAESFHNPTRVESQFGTAGRRLVYAVLGDSTGAGQGATYESGIATMTARELAKTRTVLMTNFSISGAKTEDVLLEQLPAAERIRPDLVLISVGANDVTHLTRICAVRESLTQIIHRLRAANASVRIVLTGSPDMGAPPRVPWALRPIAAWRTRRLNWMFESVARAHGAIFAPIAVVTGPLFRRDHTLFANDRFHPNERGYATWLATLNHAIGEALHERTG
jgi:lysophospholipase L1-like esterase